MTDKLYVLVDADDRRFPTRKRNRGLDFRRALATGETVTDRISASTSIEALTSSASPGSASWPWRAYEIEGEGHIGAMTDRDTARVDSFVVTAELPRDALFGPNGADLLTFFEKLANAVDGARDWEVTMQKWMREAPAYSSAEPDRGAPDSRYIDALVACDEALDEAMEKTPWRTSAALLANSVSNQLTGTRSRLFKVASGGSEVARNLAVGIAMKDLIAPEDFTELLAPFAAAPYWPRS
ncbi:hypothetical protein [Rhodococcus sp. BS-15]|uniref:hypothetical protein n=1 Tax=Rhodococcus sp. BS-15 TaxID=1304954 RepID=UPI000B1CA257|nr:hypothetical protein [Rhodococcus sp. BS-15]